MVLIIYERIEKDPAAYARLKELLKEEREFKDRHLAK